jgi:DNA polymerase III alpha subunit
MICKADTIGVFQIESRAQMSMLPRLRPRCFYDLVVEVAIVRPGPIQGDMVHPYLRRRNGEERVAYPDEAIRKVLGKTLGVPLFQEQAMALAVVAAGFTPGQADELRRAIAAWKRQGNRIAQFGEALEGGMVARGYSRAFALQVFEQIKGFSGYGFPESHAASFALLVYASAWLKRHHPAAFGAALLNSQPMGFYAPAQILRDVRDHGVAVREVDIHCSKWDTTLERGIDLARDLARSRAREHAQARELPGLFGASASAVDAVPRSSCRRTQQELDEGYLRMQVRHPTVRCAGAGCIEAWNEARNEAWNEARNGRWSPIGEPTRGAGAGGVAPESFARLHARGRSVMPGDANAAAQAMPHEPLCAPSPMQGGAPASGEHASGDDASADHTTSDHASSNHASSNHAPFMNAPSQPAIRLGLRMVRGLDVEEAHRIVHTVARHGAFRRIADLHEASGVSTASLRRLAAADAFLSMGLDRQQASWQILALRDRERPLWSFASGASGSSGTSGSTGASGGTGGTVEGAMEHASANASGTDSGAASDNASATTSDDQALLTSCAAVSRAAPHPHTAAGTADDAASTHASPPESAAAESRAAIPHDLEPNLPQVHELSAIAKDFDATGVSLKRHPIACIRTRLARARVVPCSWLRDEPRTPAGRILSVAGLVLVRQRPSTAKGILFMTIEDETGVANLIFRPKVYERLRSQVRHAAVLCVRGKVERRDGVTHILVSAARDVSRALASASADVDGGVGASPRAGTAANAVNDGSAAPPTLVKSRDFR